MSGLFLPPSVLRDQRLAREAQALLHMETAKQSAVCREFDPLLQRIDPLLSLVFCREPAPFEVVAAGARPGRYNVMRESWKGGPRTFIPYETPDGEFREPDSGLYEMLKAADWWDPAVMREIRARDDRIEDARRKREAQELEDANADVLERWLAVSRTQVSMNPDVPWAQNAAGYRRIRGEESHKPRGGAL